MGTMDNDPLRPGAGGGRKSPVLVRSVGAHYEDTPAIIATNPTWTMDSIYTSTRVWLCIGICRNRTVLWKSKTEVLLLLHLFPFESCWNKNKDCLKEFFHSPLKRSDPDHLCMMHYEKMSVTNWASHRCSFDSARLDNVLCRECKSIH